jgi:LemA protein
MSYLPMGIFIVFLFIVILFVSAFNRFVKGVNYIREAWSSIDVQLKRRHDLIPNLVETVKGYSSHEKELFEGLADLRSRSMEAGSINEKAQAEEGISKALKSLFAVAEAYPELKANQNFLDLQGQLSSIEDQLQYARRYYNGTVRNYNIRVESFPSNLIAKIFGFRKEEYFEITAEAEREVPEVKF